MKRRNLISATAAVAAVALSACAGTVDGVPVVGALDSSTTTTAQGTPLPPPTNSLSSGEPSWVPTADMSVDEVMRGGVADAYAFWVADPEMPQLDKPSASPGDITCGGELPGVGNSASYCRRGVHWDTERLTSRAALAPISLRPWTVAIIAAHETGHHFEGSVLGPKLTYQQHENVAECLAGVYIRHRFETVVSPEDIGTAYKALERDGITSGMAVPESFFYGLDVSPDLAPRDAFKACVAEWAH